MLPFVLVGGVPVLVGLDGGQLVGLSVPDVAVAPFDADEVVGFVSVDPAAVYGGAEMVQATALRQAAAGRRAGRFQPRGDRFEPMPEGEVSGFPSAILLAHRTEVPSVDVVRLSSLFAVSTVRTPIDKAEASFLCFTKLYDARQRRELPTVDEIKQCFRGLQNTKSRMFSEVAAYAPVIHDAIARGLKDRELRRYLVRETPLPTGLGIAKMSFTLALLGHDCICLDTRLMTKMFGADAVKTERGWGKDGNHVSELSLKRYEAVEDAFLEGNRYYTPGDPLGRARAQWASWESVGGQGATHSVWLNVVSAEPQRPKLAVVREDVEAGRDWQSIWTKNGLPPAPGQVIDARWNAGSGDWWVKTESGWYWLRGKVWVRAPYGPPGEPVSQAPITRYAYHTTSLDRLPRIQAHGLVPGAMPRFDEPYSEYDDGHHFFFYDDLAQVTNWPGDVVLRFPRPTDAKQNVNKYGRALPGQYATKTPVPPSAIEIGRANGHWTPLVERSHPARARAAREEELPPDAAQARDHARQVLWPTIDVGDPVQYDVGFWPGRDDSWVDAVVAHFDRDQGIDLIYVDFPFGRDTEVFDDEWRDRIRPAHTMVAQAPVEDRREGAYRGWEHRRERDEAVRVNLDPSLWPLWDRIGGQFRGTPEERTEEFMQYVHEHSREPMGASQQDADKKLDDLIAQRMAGAPARKYAIGDRVLVRPKHSRGFPTGPGEIHDIANGKYEIRWTGGEYGWFASTDLQDVSTETQAPVARATEETFKYRNTYWTIVTSNGERRIRIGDATFLLEDEDDPEVRAHAYIDGLLGDHPSQGGYVDPDTSRQGRGALPMRPKPPNPIALHQLAAAFISDIEDSRRSAWKDKLDDPRVPKIVAALRSLGFQDGIGPVLGHGAFGTACMLPNGRVLKLTSDPSEVQAGYALLGKTLPHVVAIYGAWFVRGVKIRTTLTVDQDSNPVTTRMWPMGIGIVEKVTPLDRTTTAFQGLTGTVIEYKRAHNLFPEHLTKLGPARARALLKASSEGMEAVLRENAAWLRRNDMVDDAYLAEGVADALKETRALGVYAIDVHGGNVGYVEDGKGDRVYKIFDIGSSSAPGTPHAPTVPEGGPARGKKKEADVDPTQLPFPGMLAEPQPVPWVGDEDEAPRQRRRRA